MMSAVETNNITDKFRTFIKARRSRQDSTEMLRRPMNYGAIMYMQE